MLRQCTTERARAACELRRSACVQLTTGRTASSGTSPIGPLVFAGRLTGAGVTRPSNELLYPNGCGDVGGRFANKPEKRDRARRSRHLGAPTLQRCRLPVWFCKTSSTGLAPPQFAVRSNLPLFGPTCNACAHFGVAFCHWLSLSSPGIAPWRFRAGATRTTTLRICVGAGFSPASGSGRHHRSDQACT